MRERYKRSKREEAEWNRGHNHLHSFRSVGYDFNLVNVAAGSLECFKGRRGRGGDLVCGSHVKLERDMLKLIGAGKGMRRIYLQSSQPRGRNRCCVRGRTTQRLPR